MQTAVVWSCFPFIRSGQNHLARHSERGKKTRQTEEEVGRQHQGMDGPGAQQVPEGSGEEGKMEKTDCEIICGAPATLAIKGQMMIITTNSNNDSKSRFLQHHITDCTSSTVLKSHSPHVLSHCAYTKGKALI